MTDTTNGCGMPRGRTRVTVECSAAELAMVAVILALAIGAAAAAFALWAGRSTSAPPVCGAVHQEIRT